MATAALTPKVAAPASALRSGKDARRRKRLKVVLPVSVRPFDPRFADIADVGEVTDFTRDGLFFTSFMPHYFVGMRVIATFPFGDKVSAHRKFLGKVVRLEERERSTWGVAVSFVL
jgi:hypothetical protein